MGLPDTVDPRGPKGKGGKSWRRAYCSTRAQTGCTPVSTGTDMARWPIMASLEPEPDRDQLTQAVTVGLCVALAGVLIVLAIV